MSLSRVAVCMVLVPHKTRSGPSCGGNVGGESMHSWFLQRVDWQYWKVQGCVADEECMDNG